MRSFVEYYGEQKGAGGRGKGEEENINKKIKDILKNGCPGIPREAILKLDSDLMEKSLLESCLYELDQRKQRLNYLMAEMSF